ncbi:MAG: ImcF-related family protein [Longimicrobiales bacterium]
MKRSSRDVLIACATLLPFFLLALIVPPLLALEGSVAWLAFVAFIFLGLTAALIVLLYLRARAKASPEPAPADDEIDTALTQAKKRLEAARHGSIGKLPVVLVVGPSGSTKTTILVRSGLEPELLAGEVYRGDNVVPTRAVNVWFGEKTVFVEAGGNLAKDAPRWGRLLRHLRPSRLAAILPGGAQAPRLVIVCFGCDEFLKPGAAQTVTAAAQALRTQLLDVAARLGMRLPVYVLFTKCDKLPYFGEYVRSLTREEANDVLGATLPMSSAGEAGSYAEREAGRLGAAFDGIFRTLALRRLDLLPREAEEEVRAGVYEFPREVRKAASLATQFLVDLCRPSQLGVSPFLRGFYFTGVRAVYLDDVRVPVPTTSAAPQAVDATSVFNPAQLMAQHKAAAAATGSRRVPEWAFLRRVIGQLVLRDRNARASTAGGTIVNLLRRTLVGSAAALLLIVSMGLFVSWRTNGRTLERALGGARAVERVDLAGGGVPTLEDLTLLDSLRSQLVRLREWERAGAPLSHRWGLYVGDDVLERLRPLYFHRFDRMLWATTRGRVIASLERLPPTPNEASEYGATYDALKAYLISTSHPRESTAEFLAPELMKHWRLGREVDPERAALVEQQFAFFAAELPHDNPYDASPDDGMVARTREFLRGFGNIDQFYQALITEASKVAEPARFPGGAPVSDDIIVQGAYTTRGWEFVQGNLQSVDKLFERESWVLGDATVPAGDRARIAAELRRRYVDEYIQQWQTYLASGRVAAFGGAQDAAGKLRVLGGPQSPLLRLFFVASQNTRMDSASLGRAFQPVHAVLPPSATDRLIVEGANQSYMQGLVALQAAVDQIATATAGPAREGAIGNARSASDQLKIQVQQMAQGFNSEGPAQPVGSAVERLLMAPIQNIEGLLAALPTADANAKGQSFCSQFAPLTRKFPFDPRSTLEASVDEVAAMFKPGSSALWSFYEENVRQLLVPQGEGYGRIVGAPNQPTREFEAFFNRAAEISRALFAGEGGGAEVIFEVRPEPSAQITEVRVEIDGQTQTVTATNRASRTFVWQPGGARGARMTATVNGQNVVVAQAQGAWAVFRLFHQADPNWERVAAGHYRLRWAVPSQNATLLAELRFDERIPVFKPDYFAGLQCVSRMVAR